MHTQIGCYRDQYPYHDMPETNLHLFSAMILDQSHAASSFVHVRSLREHAPDQLSHA